MTVGIARVVNQQNEGTAMTTRLPSMGTSPPRGDHLADLTSRAAFISDRNRAMFGQSAVSDPSQFNKTLQSTGRPQPVPMTIPDNTSMLSNMAAQMQA